jgi:Trk K+ transport system NAD-binding subunit
LIPHGDTLLRAGDVLAIVAEDSAREELQRICEG